MINYLLGMSRPPVRDEWAGGLRVLLVLNQVFYLTSKRIGDACKHVDGGIAIDVLMDAGGCHAKPLRQVCKRQPRSAQGLGNASMLFSLHYNVRVMSRFELLIASLYIM